MSVDFLAYNLIMNLLGFMLLTAVCVIVIYLITEERPPKSFWKIWSVFFVLYMATQFFFTDGPRVVLTDESGPVPVSDGTIRSLAPDRLTDQERLELNQDLYNANKSGARPPAP